MVNTMILISLMTEIILVETPRIYLSNHTYVFRIIRIEGL